MEDRSMKKAIKAILFARNRREEVTCADTGKARCYVCINGIVIPVL